MSLSIFGFRPIQTLKTDIHSHLIPAVDDGVKTVEDSISILKELRTLGYKKVITTPHIYKDLYPNTEADLTKQYRNLLDRIEQEELDINLELAAEYFIDHYFLQKIKNNETLLSFGNQYVLVETSFTSLPLIWDEVIFELKSSGYRPVLAHPERYQYVIEDKSILMKLKMRNIKFQLTGPSLLGVYGTAQQKIARYIIKNNWVDFIGSDLHNQVQIEGLRKVVKNKLYQKALRMPLLNYQL